MCIFELCAGCFNACCLPSSSSSSHTSDNELPSEILNTDRVKDLTGNHSYKKILEDKELFWTLFCLTVAQIKPPIQEGRGVFFEHPFEAQVMDPSRIKVIKGDLIKEFITEYFRKTLLESFKTKNKLEIAEINYLDRYHLKPIKNHQIEPTKNSTNQKTGNIYGRDYELCIKPYLIPFVSSLGATCVEKEQVIKMDGGKLIGTYDKTIQKLCVDWN